GVFGLLPIPMEGDAIGTIEIWEGYEVLVDSVLQSALCHHNRSQEVGGSHIRRRPGWEGQGQREDAASSRDFQREAQVASEVFFDRQVPIEARGGEWVMAVASPPLVPEGGAECRQRRMGLAT